jgi:hypothetical protein
MTSQGLSLRDIARLHEEVPHGDSFIKVHAISAQVALALINRYPEILTRALQGGGLKFGDIIKAAPEVLGAIIVAGTGGKFDDEEALEDASLLGMDTEMDILEAIGRLTFKNGFGPVVQRIVAIAETVKSGNLGKVPDMRSPQESSF